MNFYKRRVKMKDSKKKLFQLLKERAIFKGKIVLSSGKISNYYIDGRMITLSPQGAYLIADIILDMIRGEKIDAIGGPMIGADPMVGSIAALSHIRKKPINTFIVRKTTKSHGRMRQIEGPGLKRNSRVILVDDVATTGGALLDSLQVLSREGIKVEGAIVMLDRQEGATESLAKKGLRLVSIFKARDFGLSPAK
jgi:orotate phosphoribosyltransferase